MKRILFCLIFFLVGALLAATAQPAGWDRQRRAFGGRLAHGEFTSATVNVNLSSAASVNGAGGMRVDVAWNAVSGYVKPNRMGANLINNTGMEVGDPPDNWSGLSGGSVARSTDVTSAANEGGTYSLDVTKGGNNLCAYYIYGGSFVVTPFIPGRYYKVAGQTKRQGVSGSSSIRLYSFDGSLSLLNNPYENTFVAWQVHFGSASQSGPSDTYLTVRISATPNATGALVDNVRVWDMSGGCVATRRVNGARSVAAATYIGYRERAGVVALADDTTWPSYGLLGYYDQESGHIVMARVDDYVETVLVDMAATAVAGAEVALVHHGNWEWSVRYDGTDYGARQAYRPENGGCDRYGAYYLGGAYLLDRYSVALYGGGGHAGGVSRVRVW
jgi:hypothetical protein